MKIYLNLLKLYTANRRLFFSGHGVDRDARLVMGPKSSYVVTSRVRLAFFILHQYIFFCRCAWLLLCYFYLSVL